MSLKHVVLKEELSATGKTRWSLAGPAGDVPAFRYWQDEIQERLSRETRKAYSIAVAQFIDYLYEAAAFSSEPPRPKRARDLVEGYKALLEHGTQTRAFWLQRIAAALPHHLPVKPPSANLKLSAVCQFLEECEDLHEEAAQQPSNGATPNPYTAALGDLAKAPLRSTLESANIRQNSMLGGVIRNAANRLKKQRRLTVKGPGTLPWDDGRKEFPMDQIGQVIEAANSYRDKALYTLLACGGLRTHEALQLKISSLNPDSLRVDLVDFLYGDNPSQHELRHKGRSARYVYFWPGYEELFFHYIMRYLQKERRHLARDPHDYLFVKLKADETCGQPLFTATDKARDETFKLAQKNAGIPLLNGRGYGLHSLRHSYGVFMVNHCPWENGSVGVPEAIVRRMMGHSSIVTTQGYARDSKHKIDAVLNAGRRLFGTAGLDPAAFRAHLADSLVHEAKLLLSNADAAPLTLENE